MNAPSLPVTMPGGPQLHTRRCARHSTREAAARCPACGEFFCRECVVEHDGKFLCASCLAKQAKAGESRGERLAKVRRVLRTAAGVLVLWLVFYWLGATLLKVPLELHDGTIWKNLAEKPAP